MEVLNISYEYLREEDSKEYGATLFSAEFKGKTRSNWHNEASHYLLSEEYFLSTQCEPSNCHLWSLFFTLTPKNYQQELGLLTFVPSLQGGRVATMSSLSLFFTRQSKPSFPMSLPREHELWALYHLGKPLVNPSSAILETQSPPKHFNLAEPSPSALG